MELDKSPCRSTSGQCCFWGMLPQSTQMVSLVSLLVASYVGWAACNATEMGEMQRAFLAVLLLTSVMSAISADLSAPACSDHDGMQAEAAQSLQSVLSVAEHIHSICWLFECACKRARESCSLLTGMYPGICHFILYNMHSGARSL